MPQVKARLKSLCENRVWMSFRGVPPARDDEESCIALKMLRARFLVLRPACANAPEGRPKAFGRRVAPLGMTARMDFHTDSEAVPFRHMPGGLGARVDTVHLTKSAVSYSH
jgi:hypothetical protein